ncbi:MAG: type pantothenate kinase, partial [Verrucomicrobiota bacterium]
MRGVRKLTADYLLIDVSNSFVKLAFATTEKIGKATRLATSKLTGTAMRRILRGRKVGTIVVSSVVPKRNNAIRAAAGSARVLFLDPKLDLGVGIKYPKPRSIGADRLANAAAVAQLYGTPAIVVDFGTAVTFDVVSAKGDYVGGVIAPGLEV